MSAYSSPTARDWAINLGVVAVACATAVSMARLLGATHPIVFLVCAGAFVIVLVRWHAARSAYRCPNCSAEFQLTAWQDFISPNLIDSKGVRCPTCGKFEAMQVLTRSK